MAFAMACGGDEGTTVEEPPPPPPPPPVTTVQYDVTDPCTADVPQPNDLFIDDQGRSERADCLGPSMTIDDAVIAALLDEGAPLDTAITLPVDGSLDGSSLTSTVTFSFTSTTGPNTPQEGLPPIVMLEQVGSASVAAGWNILRPTVTFNSGRISLQPPLLSTGTRYVVVATSGLRDLQDPRGRLAQSEVVAALVGTTPIAPGTADLDAAAADRLEKERQRIQPVLELFETATNPVIPRSQIVSIHTFTTQRGLERMSEEVQRYYDAIEQQRYGYDVELTEVSPASIFVGVPPNAYPDVGRMFRGVLTAPKFLDDEGRWRDDWAEDPQTVNIYFTVSVPVGTNAGPVVLHVPAYGRGSVDGRSIAQFMAQIPAAYVMTIDMRCHGFRSPDPAGNCRENRTPPEITGLADGRPNNNNMDIQGPDGIPDDSGIGFFSGDPVKLRDGQLAAVLEIFHVLESLGDPSNYQPDVSPVVSRLHLVAQGYMAPLATIASTLSENVTLRTMQLPAGGAGLDQIILNGPADQRRAFGRELPVDEASFPALLQRLSVMFAPVDVRNYREAVQSRFRTGSRFERVLLPHPSTEEFITAQARGLLTSAIGLPNERISEHRLTCDDFYLYSCQIGQDVILQQTAVEQLVRFVDSSGITVVTPAR